MTSAFAAGSCTALTVAGKRLAANALAARTPADESFGDGTMATAARGCAETVEHVPSELGASLVGSSR